MLLGRNILNPTAAFTVTLCPPLMRGPGHRAGTLSPKGQRRVQGGVEEPVSYGQLSDRKAEYTFQPRAKAELLVFLEGQGSRERLETKTPEWLEFLSGLRQGKKKTINPDAPGW